MKEARASRPRPLRPAGRTTVKITANDRANPPGKLADAELLHRWSSCGLKLIGSSVCSTEGPRQLHRHIPGSPLPVNGERRSFALPHTIDATAQQRVRDLILNADS